ncbi:MAG: hypothetical protein ACOC2N_08595 [Spirochaetota bacterium]
MISEYYEGEHIGKQLVLRPELPVKLLTRALVSRQRTPHTAEADGEHDKDEHQKGTHDQLHGYTRVCGLHLGDPRLA